MAGFGGNFEEHGFARSSFLEKEGKEKVEVGKEEVEVGKEKVEVGKQEVDVGVEDVGEYDYSLAFTPYNRDLLEVSMMKIF